MGLLSNFRHKFHNAFFTQVLYGTVASLAIFLTSWDHLDRMRDRLQSKLQNDTDTFDFIIVGGGTAGSVVANRLSQYYSVLLLEAGGEPNPFQAVPGLSLFMPNHVEIDWMHRSVPQKRAFGNSLKREASLSQGKGLGGSGNLNFLNYLRGSPMDFEHWKNVTGDGSWGYSEMRKYFQLVEDYTKDTVEKSRGSVKLDIPDYVGLSAEFITAGDQLGYKHVDLNDEFVEGFDVNYFPIYKGVRQAPYQSYLKPARSRKSLTIRKFSLVNRILFRSNSTQAYGVEYERHGELKVAKAAKEVILSAGALLTPKILMFSGVGPAEHLQDIGIPLRLDLPVGRNLQDHLSTLVGPFFINEPRSLLLGKDIDTSTFLAWGMEGKGPLTSSFYQASALLLSSFAKSREEDHNWPDIHLQLSSVAVHKTYAQDLAHAYNLQENLLTQYYSHAAGKQSFSISVANGRPVARGEVLLSGREPKDKLIINPKFLQDSHNVDVNILKDGVKTALKLAENSTAFQKLGARLTDKKLPGCEHHPLRSDAYWECYIRQFSLSMHDYCGTAAMGKATSKYAVVDPQLKVIGAKGLRVIDASVMPSIVVGSPQGAILALAEKGAANILQYWRQFDVPSKKYDEDTRNSSKTESSTTTDNDFTDSFSGFAYLGNGKVGRVTNKNGTSNGRKISKQKIIAAGGNPKSSGQHRHSSRVAQRTSTTTTTKSPIITSSTTTQKPSSVDFEQAETRFSHNLSQIMEFLRNSRAINESLDDETYNDLVQNFGERIKELMKKNKTDIFFVPVTTPTTTTTPSPISSSRPTTSSKSGQSSSSKNVSSSPSFSSKFSNAKPDEYKGSSQKSRKNAQPFTTSKPTPKISSKPIPQISFKPLPKISFKIPTSNDTSKSKATTTLSPSKKGQQAEPYSFSSSSSGKSIFGGPAKFSPLISTKNGTQPASSVVTTQPKNLSSSTTVDALLNGESEEGEEDDTEDTTAFDDEEDYETTTTEQPSAKPKKIVELILNPDLTINKTKEIDSSTYTTLLKSSSAVSPLGSSSSPDAPSSSGKTQGRQLIEYRTEEVRPFPAYPPYKIVSVPGQEFVPGGGLVPPPPQQHHYHHHHHHLPSISSPAIILQSASSIASLTPPPPQQQQQHQVITSHHQQLPSLPQFQQAQLLAPPKLPAVIDENLPIQTAKTVLYYTQVFPRDPNEISKSSAQNNNGGGDGRVVVSSSSSNTLSLPSNLEREDERQNIVQFFPTIN